MKKNQNLTWDDIKKVFAESGRQIKESGRQIKESGRQIKETGRQMKETDRQLKEEYARCRKKLQEESDRRVREIRESRAEFKEYVKVRKEQEEKEKQARKEQEEKEKQARKEQEEKEKQEWKEMRAYLKEIEREVGGIAHSNGEMAEEYFYNAFKKNMTFVNETFDTIKKNLSYNDGYHEAEFDIVLFNGKSAALIEVKYNAKPNNVEIEKLISRVEVFRILFPKYAHYEIYLGVAAMSFKKDLVWRLHRAGIATVRPVGKKMVVYDKSVKVFWLGD